MPPEPPLDSSGNCLPCNGETIIALGSDDSDEEVDPDHGYTLLGQQEVADGGSSSDEDEEENSDREEGPPQPVENLDLSSIDSHLGNLPPPPRPSGSEEVAWVWNSCPRSTSLSLNAEKTAQIQAAMANFILPPSAVPPWAVNIPEEEWKQGLLDQLHKGNLRQSKSSSKGSKDNNN